MAVISLTTDFGLADPYVGLVKGAILSVNPQAVVVDVTHAIDPSNRHQAARTIAWAHPYFPANTINTVVVDPGVGSDRRIIAFSLEGQLFLGPDNGVFSLVLAQAKPDQIVAVENSDYCRAKISRTFHGRDIFAPVAAHLSLGIELTALGPVLETEDLVHLAVAEPQMVSPTCIRGEVVAVDRFGNLITNIDVNLLEQSGAAKQNPNIRIKCARRLIQGVQKSYAAVPPGGKLALIGSRETIEVSINRGHAARELECSVGDPVQVDWGLDDSLSA